MTAITLSIVVIGVALAIYTHEALIRICLVTGEWLGTRPLVLGVDVSEGLSVMVAHDEIGVLVLDGPRRREAALWLFCLAHAADILRPCPSVSVSMLFR